VCAVSRKYEICQTAIAPYNKFSLARADTSTDNLERANIRFSRNTVCATCEENVEVPQFGSQVSDTRLNKPYFFDHGKLVKIGLKPAAVP
jgi:hypothetical protein